MKTIEVTEEMYNSLMELSKELNTQSHRCTAMPYMIQLSEKEEVAAYEGQGEEFWFNEDGKLDEAEEAAAIQDYLYEKHGEGFMIVFNELGDYEKESILEDSGYRKHNVIDKDKLSNFFFTDKGLRDYYGKDVNTFLTGVSNPELKTVMTFLCELSGGKLHV